MTRRIGLGLMVLGVLCGCGDRPQRDRSGNPLVGAWQLSRQVIGGGRAKAVTNGFNFALNADGTWTDSFARGGRWKQSPTALTIYYSSGQEPAMFGYQFDAQNKQLRLTVTATADQPGRVSTYQRLDKSPLLSRQ